MSRRSSDPERQQGSSGKEIAMPRVQLSWMYQLQGRQASEKQQVHGGCDARVLLPRMQKETEGCTRKKQPAHEAERTKQTHQAMKAEKEEEKQRNYLPKAPCKSGCLRVWALLMHNVEKSGGGHLPKVHGCLVAWACVSTAQAQDGPVKSMTALWL